MTEIQQQDTLYGWGDYSSENYEAVNYFNIEEDIYNDTLIPPTLQPQLSSSKAVYNTQILSQALVEDQSIFAKLLSTSPEFLSPLPLPEAFGNSYDEPTLLKEAEQPTSPISCVNLNLSGDIKQKQKATRNRDKRNLKNKIEINGTFYKIAYRESLLNQLHITFEDIVHAVKVKLLSMRGILPGPDETRVTCDRIKHEVFLYDCINICRPSTRPYIHVHVNKTCTDCIRKNASRSKLAQI